MYGSAGPTSSLSEYRTAWTQSRKSDLQKRAKRKHPRALLGHSDRTACRLRSELSQKGHAHASRGAACRFESGGMQSDADCARPIVGRQTLCCWAASPRGAGRYCFRRLAVLAVVLGAGSALVRLADSPRRASRPPAVWIALAIETDLLSSPAVQTRSLFCCITQVMKVKSKLLHSPFSIFTVSMTTAGTTHALSPHLATRSVALSTVEWYSASASRWTALDCGGQSQ